MAAKKKSIIKMQSSASAYFYTTKKTKKGEKLVLKRYDPLVRQHVEFKETKV